MNLIAESMTQAKAEQEVIPPPVDFNNTEFAFQYKSDRELKRTYRLFKKIDSPFLTKIGPPILSFFLKIGLPVEGLVRKTIFDIFCGGTSLKETATTSAVLFQSGVRTILDYAVEGEKTSHGFDLTRDEIMRTLEHGSKYPEVAFSAMKVTGIAHIDLLTKVQSGTSLSEEEETGVVLAKERLNLICKTAHQFKQPLFIDAEESWIQDVLDMWCEEMMEKYNRNSAIIYTTVQMYRHDRLTYLKTFVNKAKEGSYFIGVKVVRGAYLEKERERATTLGYEDPTQKDKTSTDHDFDAALNFCVENVDRVALCSGSHNEKSAGYLMELIHNKGIDPGNIHVIFAQLLGMSDNISFNLSQAGFNAAKYVPYGPVRAVLPYLFRRAEENTSIGGQASREVGLLKKEVLRRKL